VSASINNILNCKIFFKCENFQKVGAFKFGGVCNAILENKIDVTGKTIGIILSRGNVDLQKLTF
jgi:threonine dehydratase